MRRVNPSVYTKDYYLTDCTGFDEFKKTQGNKLEPRLKELIKYFEIKDKSRVLDIGCGRGEMALYAAKNGADATGIDYSKDGIRLANILKNKQTSRLKKKVNFKVMDAKKLLFPESYFDLVIMTDVFEHLYPEELEQVFKEIKRVLKNGGTLVIHTAPNKYFNDFGYKLYSYPLSSLLVKIWNLVFKDNYPNIASPKSLRTDSHQIMHINEPTFFSMKYFIRKYNFRGRVLSTNITAAKPQIGIKDVVFNFIVFLHPFSKHFPLNIIFGSDFVAILKNNNSF